MAEDGGQEGVVEEDEQGAGGVLDRGGVLGEDCDGGVWGGVGAGYGGESWGDFYAEDLGETCLGGDEEGAAFAAAEVDEGGLGGDDGAGG